MKGNNYIPTCLAVIVFILASHADNVSAKNLKSVIKADFPILDELNACGEQCDPKNHACPMECLKKIAAKDEATFLKYLEESQVAVRSGFCTIGCAATETCETIRASSKGKFSLI